jgi:hypothetical protein
MALPKPNRPRLSIVPRSSDEEIVAVQRALERADRARDHAERFAARVFLEAALAVIANRRRRTT